MENWMDLLAERHRAREERRLGIERILNKVETILHDLLSEFQHQYHVKSGYKTKFTNGSTYWEINIDNVKAVLTAESLYAQMKENEDIESAIIGFIVNNFTFKD